MDAFEIAARIRLVLTDCDGVLTDGGVYVGPAGEVMKRFSIRDGMGVQRLRESGVEVGIVTGERSPAVRARAQKLQITELHEGITDKRAVLDEVTRRLDLEPEEVAFIGDDVNDIEIMRAVGLSAAPRDATADALETADVVVEADGGHGAFRALAELVVTARTIREST